MNIASLADAIARRISAVLAPSLKSRLSQTVNQLFQVGAGGGSGRGQSSFGRSIGRFQAAASGRNNSGLLDRLADLLRGGNPAKSPQARGGAAAGVSSRTTAPRPGLLNRVADWWGQRQAEAHSGRGRASGAPGAGAGQQGRPGIMGRFVQRWQQWFGGAGGGGKSGGAGGSGGTNQANQSQDWWRRGWGNLGGGRKRSAFTRAARLKVIAQRRLSRAQRALAASTANRGKPGWNPYQHGQRIAAVKSARQKLHQATSLQARATSLGAIASGRVASALSGLGGKLVALGSRFALPASVAVAVARLPWQLQAANDARINSLREGAKYSGRLSAAFAQYDLKTENLKALNARDTADSTAALIAEQNKLRTGLQPYTARLQNLWTNVQTLGTRGFNQFREFEENRLGWMAAGIAELEQAARQGRLPSLKGVQDIKKEMDEMDEQERKDRQKVFQRQFSDTAKAWVDSINHKKEARANNNPKKPLPPLN